MGAETPTGMPQNVFVLGLDQINRETLESLPDAGNYRFHSLLSVPELQEGDIEIAPLLEKAQAQLEAFDGSVDAIVGYWDFPVSSLVPILCERWGLHSASLKAVVTCEHKYWSRLEQRAACQDCAAPFALVDLRRDRTPPGGLRYPMWLKPVKSFSSELAFEVSDDSEFRMAVEKIRDGIGRVGSAFQWVLDQLELPAEIAEAGGAACLAEEEVAGVQLTVEGYCYRGAVHVYGVIDSIDYPDSSSFLRYQYPSQLPEDVQGRVRQIAELVIRQIGLNSVPFNIEFFADLDSGRLTILEVNPRHSQSHAPLFEQVDGAPNHHYMLRLALGKDPEMPNRQGQYAIAAKWYLRRFADGVVRRVPSRAEITRIERDIPGTTIELVVGEGDRLSGLPAQDSYSYELADIFTGAGSEAELRKNYEECVRALRFEFDD